MKCGECSMFPREGIWDTCKIMRLPRFATDVACNRFIECGAILIWNEEEL